jgi:phage baseplate assembly protein W
VVAGRANLVQALVVRLATERGELAPLGHPGYGSRHHELIGEPNTETNRNLVKLHVLDCLRQEPRLAEIRRVDVRPAAGREERQRVTVDVEVVARGEPTPLSLVIPFSFAGPLG